MPAECWFCTRCSTRPHPYNSGYWICLCPNSVLPMLFKCRQRGLRENSELAMQGTGLSLTIIACSAAQQGHQHHHQVSARQVPATSGIFFFLSLLAVWQCFYLERISIRPLFSGSQACINFAARSLARSRISALIILSFAEWRARTSCFICFHVVRAWPTDHCVWHQMLRVL